MGVILISLHVLSTEPVSCHDARKSDNRAISARLKAITIVFLPLFVMLLREISIVVLYNTVSVESILLGS